MRSLADIAVDQAARHPNAVAVVFGTRRLTYGQLESRARRLASLLRKRGVQPGDRVCLFLPKGPEAIVAMLGVLKAGGIYVPVDLSSPTSRLAEIARACEPRLVIRDPAAPAVEIPACGVLELGPGTAIDGFPAAQAPLRAPGSEAAHILFTSGSTGRPKGVVITHASILHFVGWAVRHFGIAPGDRLCGHAPLHFDLSTFDVYGSLAAGAELHLAPPELNLLPHLLAAFIRSSELTQWLSVPSALTFLARHDVLRPADFASLRRVLWCGEVLPTPVLAYWMERVPHATFTNLYGPTETTIASCHHEVAQCPDADGEPVPVGVPIPGEQIHVLDPDLRPVAEGEVGEIYIEGAGLACGYWRDDARTRHAFLPSPFEPGARMYRTGDLARWRDGLLHFLGRADSQIKSRGYRIELGEVEAALHAMRGLRECAVVAVPATGFEGATICCAYAGEPRPAEIRGELAKRLPSYMLPSRWRVYESLPRNPNGKTDRNRLREEFVRGLS